jgi:hypothetical protein
MAHKTRKSRAVPLLFVPFIVVSGCSSCDESYPGQFIDPETGQPVADQPPIPPPDQMKYCTDSEGKVVDDALCESAPDVVASADVPHPPTEPVASSNTAPAACASVPYGPPPPPVENTSVVTTTTTEHHSDHFVEHDHHYHGGLVVVPRPYVWYYGGPIHFVPGQRVYGGNLTPRVTRVYVTPGISRGVAPPLVTRGGFGSTGATRVGGVSA